MPAAFAVASAQSFPRFSGITTPDDTSSRTSAFTLFTEYGTGSASFINGKNADGQSLTTTVKAIRNGDSATVSTVATTFVPLPGSTSVYIGATGFDVSGLTDDHRTFIFGGKNNTVLTMNVAVYDGATGSYTDNFRTVATNGQTMPEARTGAAAAYLTRCNMTDPANPKPCIVMFGGAGAGGLLNDVYALWITENPPRWQLIQAKTTSPTNFQPTGRQNAIGASSADGTTMYVYGGQTATGPVPDMFALAPAGFQDPTTAEMDNVALRTTARQSTILSPWGDSGPGVAVDGLTKTVFDNPPYMCTHSTDELRPWWVLKLNSTMNIDAIRILPRSDCCGWRNRAYEIFTHTSDPNNGPPPDAVAGTRVTDPQPNLGNAPVTVYFAKPRTAQYVWISLANLGWTRALSLCEVYVYVKRPWIWRQLSGSVNVAQGKPARQTSLLTDWGGGDPNRAVDGETANNYDATKTCAHTAGVPVGTEQFWQVDLGGVYDITTVRVWPRTDCCTNRNDKFILFAGDSRNNYMYDQKCFGPASLNGFAGSPLVAANAPEVGVYKEMPCSTKARYITLAKSPQHTGGDDSTIMLCEVQVWGEKLRNQPTARRDFSSVIFRGSMVIYGGTDANGFRMDDIRFFDLHNREWLTAFDPLGVPPQARALAGLAILSSDHLLLHGGSTNGDVSSDMSMLKFPTCPTIDKFGGVQSVRCTGGGNVCIFVCQAGWKDQNNGKPVICRQDGQVEGFLPPCLTTGVASAPTSVAVTVQNTNTSVFVSWAAPGNLGYYGGLQGAAALKGYRVRAEPYEFFEDFGNNKFLDETKWKIMATDVNTASYYYFEDGRLIMQGGPGSDTWTNYVVDDVNGNYVDGQWAVRNAFLLYRDWPTEVDPAGEWAIEVEMDAVFMCASSLASIGLVDMGYTPAGAGRGEVLFWFGIRYTDWGEAGANMNIVWESNGGRLSRQFAAMSSRVFLRLERVLTEEKDREGNFVFRGSVKYDPGARWTRIYSTFSRRHLMKSGWNATTLRLQGPGLQPANIRPFLGIKVWNGNDYARATTAFRYMKISQGLKQARQGNTFILPRTAVNTTITGLTDGARYNIIVEALTDAGYGARATAVGGGPLLATLPAKPVSTVIDWGVREIGVGKQAFVRPNSLDTYWGNANPGVSNDGNWIGIEVAGGGSGYFHTVCNNLDWFGIDLGVDYADVKSIRIRTRADADWAAYRGRQWSIYIGDDVRGPFTTNQHVPIGGPGSVIDYTKYWAYPGKFGVPEWLFGDWGIFNWPSTTIWQGKWDTNTMTFGTYTPFTSALWQTDPDFCQTRVPTPGQGRYIYVGNNVGDCMHFTEMQVYASNSCPARAYGPGSVIENNLGGLSCAANARFGTTCEHTCTNGEFIQSGTKQVKCNGAIWTGSFAAPVVCSPTCPEVEAPPYAETMSHVILDENFVNIKNVPYRLMRMSTLNPVFSPLANVWNFDDGTAQAIGRLGLPEEPSLVFVVDKIRAMDQFSVFKVETTFSTTDKAGILFRVVDAKNFYRVTLDMKSGRHVAEAVVNGVPQLMSDARLALLSDSPVKLAVSVAGFSINVTVNGKTIIQTQDRQFSQGYVGMYAQSTARFTNFKFTRTVRSCAGVQQGERCEVSCQAGLTNRGSPLVRTCDYGYGQSGSLGWDYPLTTPTMCTLDPPIFPSAVISVKENSPRNTLVGAPLVAQSTSPNFPVQYQLNRIFVISGPNATDIGNTLFSVDFCTGQVKVRQNNALDYEFNKQYLIEVRVYVAGFTDAYTDRNVTVNILNVDEPPFIIITTLSFREDLGTNSVIGPIQWWDPENDTVAWTVDIPDARYKVAPTTGIVSVAAKPVNDTGFSTMSTGPTAPLSFEGGKGQSSIFVSIKQVTGDTTLGASGQVTLLPLDMNDPPYFSPALQSIYIPEVSTAGSSFVPFLAGAVNVIDEDLGVWNSTVTGLQYNEIDPSLCGPLAQSNIPTDWYPGSGVPTPWSSGGANNLFSLNAANGQITMIRRPGTQYGQDSGSGYIWQPYQLNGVYIRAQYTMCVRVFDGYNSTTAPVSLIIRANMPNVPFINGISPATFAVTGGTVNITGGNFMAAPVISVSAYYTNGVQSYNATGCAVRQDNSITCNAVTGFGGKMQWYVRLNGKMVIQESPIFASYLPPEVTKGMTSAVNMSTQGVVGVNIGGKQFAPSKSPVTICYGPVSNPCKYQCAATTVSATSIFCNTQPGGGRNLVWSLIIGGQANIDSTSGVYGVPAPVIWSYAYPTISSIAVPVGSSYTPYTLSTEGGQALLITGNNFGPVDSQLVVSIGGPNGRLLNMPCLRDSVTPHTLLRCTAPAGAGAGHKLYIEVEGTPLEAGLYTQTYPGRPETGLGYLPPVVTRMYGPGYDRADTAGGQRIVIEGTNFGPSSDTIDYLKYGPSASNLRYTATGCRVTIANVMIECYSDQGVGKGLVYQLSIGTQIMNNTGRIFGSGSYAPPSVAGFSGLGAHGAVTRGAQDVVITGRNFGPMDAYTNGLLVVSYGVDLQLDITNANGTVIIGSVTFNAALCSITVAHTELTCKTTEGAGNQLEWNVVVAGQKSATPTTDYAPPFIQGITYKTNGQPVNDADVDGGQWVVVSGQFMGPTMYATSGRSLVQGVSYGVTGSEYIVPESDWRLVDHETLEARLQPGTGANLLFRVEVADQMSISDINARFSYAPPVIVSINPAMVDTYSDPKAQTIITLTTRNLPLKDPNSRIQLAYGNTDATKNVQPRILSTLVVPKGSQVDRQKNPDGSTWLQFNPPRDGGGLGVGLSLQVIPANSARVSQSSAVDSTNELNFNNPVITDVIVTRARFGSGNGNSSCPFSGNEWSCQDLTGIFEMVILGKDFTSTNNDWQDGITRNLEVMIVNNTDIFLGPLGPIWSDARGLTSKQLWIVSWDHTRIFAYYRRLKASDNTDIVGGTLRMTIGSSAWYGPANQVLIKDFKEQNPEITAITGAGAAFPTPGGTTANPVGLTMENLNGALNLEATVGGRSATLLKQVGSTYVPFTGPADVQAWIGSGSVTSWTVYVQIPPGQGLKQKVQLYKITSDGRTGSNDQFTIDYMAPTLDSVQVVRYGVAQAIQAADGFTVVTVPTDGQGGVVRMYGSNLGLAPTVDVGDGPIIIPASAIKNCSIVPAPAYHTCYEFTAPAGEGNGRSYLRPDNTREYPNGYQLQLDAGGQATQNVKFSYEAPTVSTVRSLTGLFPTRGGVVVTLTGNNFGKQSPLRPDTTITVAFGKEDGSAYVPCTNVVRLSHTVMNCTLPEGSGKNVAVKVSVAGLDNLDANGAPKDVNVFSYNKPVITGVTVYALDGVNGTRTINNSTVDSNFLYPVSMGDGDGNDLIVITGLNFGASARYRDANNNWKNGVHCAFLTWAYRRVDPTRIHTCDNVESFLGEGEISAANIVSWTHEELQIITPPGIGVKDIELSIRGSTLEIPQQDNRLRRFMYEAPTITGLWPGQYPTPLGDSVTKFGTEGNEIITAFGSGFGYKPITGGFQSEVFAVPLEDAPALPTATVVIVFHRACVSDSFTVFGARPAVSVPFGLPNLPTAELRVCAENVTVHEPNRLVFSTGAGIGKNRTAYVMVMDGPYVLKSEKIYFDYKAPKITDFEPRIFYMKGSKEDILDIKGDDFGNKAKADEQGWSDEEKDVKVVIGGYDKACVGPGVDRYNQPAPDRRRQGDPEKTIVMCQMDQTIMPVGIRNVSLTVAGQTGRFEAQDEKVSLVLACAAGYFGRVNETCLPCPRQSDVPALKGAECLGFDDAGIKSTPKPNVVYPTLEQRFRYPRPMKGWYNLNSSDAYTRKIDGNPSMMDACPDGYQGTSYIDGDGKEVRMGTDRDVCIMPCDPPESCLGDNNCAEGYTSKPPEWRCAYCDKGYYRRAGECIKCPDSPAALFVGFILLVIVVAGVGFALNRKQINIAVLSIGVDFFQVLAIFAQARVKWPPIVKELLHVLSAFNLNIEIVAPECLIPDVSYKQKFWFIMILPLCIASLFGLNYVAVLAYKALIQGQPKKMWHTHKPALVSSCLVLLYLLYLYLTRTIFDVFNCAPTYPSTKRPDGTEILYLQVVFEACFVPGGTHLTLLPYAIAGLVVYTIGYPAFIGYVLFKNRELVMEDQLLRAKGTGQDKLTNPRAYDLRITYGRSYFQFKPDWCLWILAIVFRKFCIAITAVVFGKNSSFQMAACLLIMFLAYAAQVQIRPYLSPGDFDEVVKSHTEASYSSAVHARLRASLAGIESRGRKKAHKNLINFEGKIDRTAVFGVLTGFFFNYNTVEAIMTFCAVIVCLMAIMYQANELNSYYSNSKDSVTSVVLIIVIWAIVYFFTVLVTEIVVLYNEDTRAKQLAKAARNARGDKAKTGSDADDNARRASRNAAAAGDETVHIGNVESTSNPMFLSKANDGAVTASISTSNVLETVMSQRDAPPVELWRVFQSSFSDMHSQITTLQDQLLEAKKAAQTGASAQFDDGPRTRTAARTQFTPQNAGADGVNPLMKGKSGGMSLAATRKAASTRKTATADEE